MSKDLKRQLTRLKELQGQINPDPSWISENRQKLLSQITNTVDVERPHITFAQRLDSLFAVFAPEKFIRAGQPLLVAFLAVTLTVGGWIAGASAAYNSIPGDAMYGVKIASEKTQVAIATVTGDKKGSTQLHIEFATRRSEEVKKVVERASDDAPVLVEKTIKKLKESIETAKEQAKTVGEENNAEGAVLAKDIGNKTIEIAKNLQETAKIAAAPATITNEVVSDDAKKTKLEVAQKIVSETVEAKKVVNDASLDVLKTAVQKNASGTNVSETVKKDIVDLVRVKIETLSEDAEQMEKETKEKEFEAIKVTKEVIDPLLATSTVATSTITSENDSTKKQEKPIAEKTVTETKNATISAENKLQNDIKIKESAEQIQKAIQNVERVEKKAREVTSIIEEAKTLVNTDKVIEAIEKAKEFNSVHGEVQRQILETKSSLQEVVKSDALIKSVIEQSKTVTESKQATSTVSQPKATASPNLP